MRLNATTLFAAALLGSVVPLALARAETSRAHAAQPAASHASAAGKDMPAPGKDVPAPGKDLPAGEPQQTTATFGDWTLRCAHVVSAATPGGGATQLCEVTQGVNNQDRPFAQVGIGRPGKGKPLQMAILVPPSVNVTQAAALVLGKGGGAPIIELTWRRCLPGGCVADSALPTETLNRLRGLATPAQIVFADGGSRAVGLPFSSKGLSQAMDALAKEDPG